jgi:hypothetical protein
MTIIQKGCAFLNLLEPAIQQKIRRLFQFGFISLSIQRITSLNSNARCSLDNIKTAESKIYRLARNERVLRTVPVFLIHLGLVHDGDLINVDFSDFNGRQVLMFAKQTAQGRAIPLYFDFIIYPIKEPGSQNIFIIQNIIRFLELTNKQVKFVFDRGFAIPDLIKFLAKNKLIFYVRIKKDKLVEFKGKNVKAVNSTKKDSPVYVYGNNLRLVVSDRPESRNNEPWYIITNDKKAGRQEILDIYYHRFEIEELFRDAKRIFGLEFIKLKKDVSFRIVLWFVILGMWFVWYMQKFCFGLSRTRKRFKNGFQLSIIYNWLEWIQYELKGRILGEIRFAAR